MLKLEDEEEDITGRDGKLVQFYLTLLGKDKLLVIYIFLKVCVCVSNTIQYMVDDCCVCRQSTSRSSEVISEVMLQR